MGVYFRAPFFVVQPRAVCQLVEGPSSMHFMSIGVARVLGIAWIHGICNEASFGSIAELHMQSPESSCHLPDRQHEL